MIKKILLVSLIPALVLVALLGHNYLRDEEDVDKIMQYVDCENEYVGIYTGWIQTEYSPELLRGYEQATEIIGAFPLAEPLAPVALFVDVEDNVHFQSLYSNDYSFRGKINEDGSFEITDKGKILSGNFVFDEETSLLSASGTSEFISSFAGLAPVLTWEVEPLNISVDCDIPEEVEYDLDKDGDEFDSEDRLVKIRNIGSGGSAGIPDDVFFLEPNTKIKYHIEGEDAFLEILQGSLLINRDEYPEDKNLVIILPQAIVIPGEGSRIAIDVKEEKTSVFVEKGETEVTSLDGEKSITLTDGDIIVMIGDQFPEDAVNLYGEQSFFGRFGF